LKPRRGFAMPSTSDGAVWAALDQLSFIQKGHSQG
jgi:hypothetical protein